MRDNTIDIEKEIRNPKMEPSLIESIEKLKKKVHERDKRMKELKKETTNIIAELDYAYKELRRTQEELIIREKLNVAGGLAAGIADEIRNSLNIIGISVQHIHNKFTPGDERREFTEAIMNKLEKLNEVASDLIKFARPYEPDFEKSNIHKILDGVLKLVKFNSLIQNVKVIKKYTLNLPPAMIDKELIEQAFINLIDNALWAMPNGGKLIIATNMLFKDNFIEIRVSDSGCGISRKDISYIFDPFFTRKANSTGLGLSIVHRIIEEHKGLISVESQLNKGTTFIIELPISPKNDRQ